MKNFFKWKDLFDFSNYPKDSKFFNDNNKKLNGKMKDEFGGAFVAEFVELKSKMHSRKMWNIKHQLRTYEIDKISLSCFDDKRYVLDDGIRTFAYFHKNSVTSCKEIKKDCDKEDCDNWKRLWWLKKIVMIEKDCD